MIEITCHRCQSTLPGTYSFSGQHVKKSCSSCGRYIKFVDKSTIADALESKNKIWALTTDLSLIEKEKAEMAVFHSDLSKVAKNVYYHNLYVNIVKKYFI